MQLWKTEINSKGDVTSHTLTDQMPPYIEDAINTLGMPHKIVIHYDLGNVVEWRRPSAADHLI